MNPRLENERAILHVGSLLDQKKLIWIRITPPGDENLKGGFVSWRDGSEIRQDRHELDLTDLLTEALVPKNEITFRLEFKLDGDDLPRNSPILHAAIENGSLTTFRLTDRV